MKARSQTVLSYLKCSDSGDKSLQKQILTPKTQTDLWPALIATKYPINDPDALKYSVFFTYLGHQYSTIMLNDNNVYGDHFNVYTKMHNANATEYGSIQSNWVSLYLSNHLAFAPGFFIPDKNGTLTWVKDGDLRFSTHQARAQSHPPSQRIPTTTRSTRTSSTRREALAASLVSSLRSTQSRSRTETRTKTSSGRRQAAQVVTSRSTTSSAQHSARHSQSTRTTARKQSEFQTNHQNS